MWFIPDQLQRTYLYTFIAISPQQFNSSKNFTVYAYNIMNSWFVSVSLTLSIVSQLVQMSYERLILSRQESPYDRRWRGEEIPDQAGVLD